METAGIDSNCRDKRNQTPLSWSKQNTAPAPLHIRGISSHFEVSGIRDSQSRPPLLTPTLRTL
jgi:hypothetical protein